MNLSRTRRTPIGIDVGARRIKAAQAIVRGSEIVRIRSASIVRSADQAITGAEAGEFRAFLGRQGFQGNRIALAAPAPLLKIETLELPPASDNLAIARLAALEIGRIAKLKSGGFESGACVIPSPARGGASTHMIAIALAHAQADELVNPFLETGLDVMAVCPVPESLSALVARAYPTSEQQFNVVLDLGWAGTRLVVVHGKQLIFHRELQDVGVRSLRGELIARLDIPEDVAEHVLQSAGINGQSNELPRLTLEGVHRIAARAAEAIRNELSLTQNYIAHRYQRFNLEKLILTGGGASIPGLGEFLSETAPQSVFTLSLSDLLAKPSKKERLPADTSPLGNIALATALSALEVES